MKKTNKKDSSEILIIEIKMLVRENLKFCDEKSTPYLCAYKQSQEGYNRSRMECSPAIPSKG
jgi:hypothetical protein